MSRFTGREVEEFVTKEGWWVKKVILLHNVINERPLYIHFRYDTPQQPSKGVSVDFCAKPIFFCTPKKLLMEIS